jgi:hypothetical protein
MKQVQMTADALSLTLTGKWISAKTAQLEKQNRRTWHKQIQTNQQYLEKKYTLT